MGKRNRIRPGPGGLIQQKNRKPPVKAHKQDLFHGPHHIGKTVHRQTAGKIVGIDILLAQLPV
jgi:hypothetical protein